MINTTKLKQPQIYEWRERFLEKNSGKCPLCGEAILPKDRALDHDHKTGHIRDTLHMDCNILLGKIENYIGRYGKRFREEGVLHAALKNMSSYIHTDYTQNPLHPTHRTPEDKVIRVYKRRMRLAKTQATKDKYKALIAEAKNGKL